MRSTERSTDEPQEREGSHSRGRWLGLDMEVRPTPGEAGPGGHGDPAPLVAD